MEKSESGYGYQSDLNLKATELRLGLPGSEEKSPPHSKTSTKRAAPQQTPDEDSSSTSSTNSSTVSDAPPVAKAQIVGWPPVRSYRKNANLQTAKKSELAGEVLYLKVSMDGAPYLRKIDVKVYRSYPELLEALQKMFSINIGQYMERQGYIYEGSEYAPTYEDKDGDWMLVGDVPWDMFVSSCKKLRIIKASEAKGLRCL